MKKGFVMVALAAGAIYMMSGCGKDKIIGDWEVYEIKTSEMEEPLKIEDAVREQAEAYSDVSEEEIQEAIDMFDGINLHFEEDGTCIVSHSGYGISEEGTWVKNSDGTYSISGAGDYTELSMEGGKLVQYESDSEMLIYAKN